MPLTEIETEICEVVVRRFLDKHEGTPRDDLLSKFRTPLYVPLQKLTSRFVLFVPTHTVGSETFLPKAVAFHYSKDAAALSLAHRSTEVVLQAIRNLFDRQLDTGHKESLTAKDVLEEAQKTDPAVSPDMVWLGLYLAEEFSVFGMIQKDSNQVGLTAFRPTEHVYDVVKTDNFWEKHIREGTQSVEHNWTDAQLDTGQSVLEVPELEAAEIESHGPTEKRKIVFVIHGRDERLRAGVFAFLRALHLDPLEWVKAIQLTGKASPYIGEILEAAFNHAQAVVVLLSPDDEAKLREDLFQASDPPSERLLTGQARPNVLFEAGMAFGTHSKRSVLVQFGEVRPFSDVAGRHIVKMDNSVKKRQELALKLKTSGCSVDMEGIDWHTTGDLTPPAQAKSSRRAPRNPERQLRKLRQDKPWDLWLGFDGAGQTMSLCIINSGPESIFNATVKIPEDGSCFRSEPISRVDPSGSPHGCPAGTMEAIRKAVGLAISTSRIEPNAKSVPVRISFSDLEGSQIEFDKLELALPLKASSFRRRNSF